MDARARIIDAYVALLLESGERAATIDAIAARAGLSKGGLLYHFSSTDDLVDGLVDRVESLEAARNEQMERSPAGPTATFLRTSLDASGPMARAIIALARVSSEKHPQCAVALVTVYQRSLVLVEKELEDPIAARGIVALGNGLNFASLVDEASIAEYRETIVSGALRALEVLRSAGWSAAEGWGPED